MAAGAREPTQNKGSVLKLILANIIKLLEKNKKKRSQSALHYYGFICFLFAQVGGVFCAANKTVASETEREGKRCGIS